MVIREQYLAWLRSVQDQKLIKVITGVRRCGKSTLLELFREDLKKRGVKSAQIQSYNFEDAELYDLRDWQELHKRIVSKLNPTSMNYIFLDEVQKIDHFEEAVSSLATRENVDVYITGSNAFLLSGELATLLTGRYITLHILPLSFAEFVQVHPDEQNMDRLFSRYLDGTSFPEAATMLADNPAASATYLRDLYQTIIEKDIATRYDIRRDAAFSRVVKFILDSIGSQISANTISRRLEQQGISISNKTISNYLDYLSECYFIYPASRYDLKGGNILTTNDKYYVVDLGVRQVILGQSPESDIGHKIENIVYLELLRRNNSFVFIGRSNEREVDFVVQKYNGEREYYQVAYQVGDPKTLERELEPLRRIRDNYPKTLLTMDLFPENLGGIRKMNLVDWLLGKES